MPQNHLFLILALGDQERRGSAGLETIFAVGRDRTPTPGWRNTDNQPYPCMCGTVTLSTLLSPLFHSSTPHWFGWEQLHLPTLSLEWLRAAQLSSRLEDCPDSLLLPCWLSGCWSAPRTPCPCSSPETPHCGTPPTRTQREEAQGVKSKHTGKRCSHRSPAVSSSPKKPERGNKQLEFKGHFLSKEVDRGESKTLTANTDCFLVIKLLCLEAGDKKCKDHQ